ncbi:unnamed protein product [Sphagnum compactum]
MPISQQSSQQDPKQQAWVELQTYDDNTELLHSSTSRWRQDGTSELQHHGSIQPASSQTANLTSAAGVSLIEISENMHKVPVDELPLLPQSPHLTGTDDEARLVKQERLEQLLDTAGASVGSSVFNLATTVIGAGIMALPATMRVLGVPIGLLTMLLMGVLSEISIEMIVHFLDLMEVQTFGDMVGKACGWPGRVAAQICIIVNNAGILIVYLIILGDVLAGSLNHSGLFEDWVGASGWWTNRKLIVVLLMVFVLAPLSALKRIDSLKFSSAVAVALALVFVILASAIAVVKLVEGTLEVPRMLPSFGSKRAILELFTVIPIMSNAFVCQFNVPPIYTELQHRSPAKMFKVGRISTSVCVLVYMATALSGYLLFGDLTASDVLANFDKDLGIRFSHVLNDVIRIVYAVHLMLVFPVIHYSLRQTIDGVFFPRALALAESNLRFAILTSLLLTLVFIGSTVVPNIWIAFQFTGATAGLSLGFMFPALVVLRRSTSKWSTKTSHENHALAWGMLIMAIVISVIGIATQIYNLTTGEDS